MAVWKAYTGRHYSIASAPVLSTFYLIWFSFLFFFCLSHLLHLDFKKKGSSEHLSHLRTHFERDHGHALTGVSSISSLYLFLIDVTF